jgi:hypothetical protein
MDRVPFATQLFCFKLAKKGRKQSAEADIHYENQRLPALCSFPSG